MSFPKYPQYKNSGVSWIGDVPLMWSIGRLKHLLRIRGGQDYKVVESTDPTDIPVIGSGGQFTYATTHLYDGESVLLGRKGTIDKPLYIRGKFWTVDTMFYTEVLPEANGRYAYYAATTIPFSLYSTNTALPSMSQFDLANHALPLPIYSEQSQIARFLDHETAKIDALIREQERLIALLQEKRQAVISHAVTKGLDPNVPMKDSGVEWLGEVPEHWKIRKLSTITNKITNGYVGPTRGLFVDDGVRYLQSLHIKNNEIRFNQPYFVKPEWSEQHSKSILREGDVLVVQTGDIGQSAVVTKEFSGSNCHALIVVSPVRKVLNGTYLSWVLNSPYGKNTLLSIQTGALHPHLNCGYVKDVWIPLPPVDEQQRIIHYLQTELASFQSLANESSTVARMLGERRSALISAAVTGKIDVRNWQPPVDESAFNQEGLEAGSEVTA